MEIMGAAVTVAKLLGLSIKASKAAKGLIQSVIHAPAELVGLAAKLDRIHSCINLLQNIIQELSISDSKIFSPPNIRKLRSIGFSDWKVDSPSDHLLYGASGASALEEALFALEVFGLSPNLESYGGRTPIGIAALNCWLKGVVAFIEGGTDINTPRDIPLMQSIGEGRISQTTHYLIYCGADPNLSDPAAHNSWHSIWDAVFDSSDYQPKSWIYMQIEGVLTHMLLHNADLFTFFATDTNYMFRGVRCERWYDSVAQIRASEVARAWSYPTKYGDRWCSGLGWWPPSDVRTGFESCFERLEESRSLESAARWLPGGLIYPSSPKSVHEPAIGRLDPVNGCKADNYEDMLDSDFFQNATNLYRHIDTEGGRVQLSRFLLVRALCDALQHVGYRA
ncbi:uncharacterized protein F4822DRAFT_432792 [Hypoxylon trugodes]|uniref:uncharacterized protein n=1 Tax=Hypoxylon trugodes TaxID=326681 RepID=UPI00219EC2D7|nr:uncharacterized protein F4822DRAFT_432792 [Hypoxylon trugodes]KAI1385934.1 hypothetical protein F4822DRAFT_432792 [Hypoxylon trugodes]